MGARLKNPVCALANTTPRSAAVAAVPSADLRLVGLALRAERNVADKVLKGLTLHR